MASVSVGDDGMVFGEADDVRLVRSTRLIWLLGLLFAAFLGWAWLAKLDEVASGQGRVVPVTREQVIQSLEGGILKYMPVRQDDVVMPGQILAQLDPTMTESNVEESASKYRAGTARIARLEAEVNDVPIRFPAALDDYPDLQSAEMQLYDSRRRGLDESTGWIRESLGALRKELSIAQSLVSAGAASSVEVLRLQQKVADLEMKQADLKSQYIVQARSDMANARAETESLTSVVKGRSGDCQDFRVRPGG